MIRETGDGGEDTYKFTNKFYKYLKLGGMLMV